MEMLDGMDLDVLVRRFGPLPPARVAHLLAQACDSLEEAHARGLIHRDIKPANIYVCRSGHRCDFIKVLDFGLVAKSTVADADPRLTLPQQVAGTPSTMAPEVARGGRIDGRTDLYALGCVAYWLLTGRPVFEGKSMFDLVSLPPAWPVYVSQAEAVAYARWRGARLPTEAEFQRAAYGSPGGERTHPWGEAPPDASRGVFDFASWDPEAAGSHPKGASAWGVEDLVGNGWEWTSTPFGPFPGFEAMASYPEYSADFFDGEHVIMKGASMATAKELLRPTFRNWFRVRYPYVYATFRCAT